MTRFPSCSIAIAATIAIGGCGTPNESIARSQLRQIRHHAVKLPIMVEWAGKMADARANGQDATCTQIASELHPDILNSHAMLAAMPESPERDRAVAIFDSMLRCVPSTCADAVAIEHCAVAQSELEMFQAETPAIAE